MLKLSRKKRIACLALAVAATILGANNSFAASVVHDKAITESNNYGKANRQYWQGQGVYDAANHTYTFNEDITLKPKTSEQNLNFWTPLFGGIYVAGYNPVTIDMQGHRLNVAMNMDPVAQGAVYNPGAISPNVLHVTSSSLTINNVKGMELSAAGPGLATGNITGIYLAGTNQEGSYHDGKGLSSLTINNADGWDNAIKFHSSQEQVENGIYVWKNSGSADLKISGLVDFYVGNGNDVITVRGGDYTGDTQGAPTAYIGGGALKANGGRAANVVGGELSINSKLENGKIIASDANRDVQIEGNIRVGDVGRDQGTVTLGLNTADSYFKGIMYTNYGEGDAHMMLQNGAQWTNASTSQGNWDYHGSTLKQFVGSEGAAGTGYIFQKDKAALNLGNYSGYTSIFYEHKNDGTATADYTAGNTIVDTAKVGSNITLITDNVDVNNEKTVNAALNALAGKLYYNAAKKGEGALDGMAVIAEGLTASSKALKTAGIYFNDQTGQGTTAANINQTKTDFTTTLTGVQDNDTEYAEANVIAEDGSYKFKKDSTITTTDKNGADLKQAATINAGKTLTFNTNVTGGSTVYALGASSADGITVNAGKLVINANSTNGRVEGINVGQGAQSKDNPMKLTINGDTEMNMKGIGYTLGLYANGNAEVTFNGNVTAMGNENSEWGLTSEEGAFGYYGCSLVYSGSNYSLQMGPKVTINGDVNAKIDGNGLFANGGHAKLTINGGGNIEINKDNEHNYYAMMAESGTTSMNVNLDENYDAISARDNKLVLKGNVGASTGAINPNEPELYTKVNLGLATADSVWTGVAHNGFKDEGNKSGSKTFYGAINVFLQNGATWNNEEWGETSTPWGGTGFAGSHVAKFVGGVSDAKAGNIFQNDSNNLTIDNYSGNTNIFYAHTGNGEAAENYAAGDTIIKGAAAGSVVSMITDNTGVAMDNKDSIANVLNALAGKLTYSNFTKGEKNLTGYVKIADGLTASSKAKYTADITFNESGKGTYDKAASVMPDHQVKTEFTTTLTGVKADDGEYVAGGVFVKDGSYKFTEDSSITTDDKSSIDLRQAATIDAKGKTLTLNANSSTGSTVYGLGASSADGVTVNAGKLVINGSSTNGRVEGFNVGQGAQSKDKPMKLTINGDTEFNMKGIGYTLGLYANGNSDVTFNGNVTAMGNENSEWGLTSEEGAFGYYGCSLVYSGSNYSLQMGPKVTINGDVNAKIDGNALFANGGHAKLTINGGGNIEINKDNEHNYYAMIAESGTTSMNVNLDENYDAVSARDNKLVLKGNVGASTGAINANEPELYTKVNLGLATADSVWTGVAHNGFKDEGNKSGSKTFYGAINVFLQNGATWNNEEWGEAVDAFAGSHIAKFAGGVSDAKAGNIFQKDSNNLTIDNYSGNTNIFYAHTGNGEAAENYAAGDTVIRSAAEGSVVSMITDNTGIAMDNKDSVNNVLNALAGKLTYSNYVNDENNLTGYVKIADGLTASSKALETGDISFSKEDGKGYYTNVPKPKTIFTTAITGDIEADTEYAGNIADGKYFFDGDSTITVGAATAANIKKALTIDAGDHKLSFIATGGDWAEEKAFKHTASGTTKITAGELVIGQHDGGYYDRTGIAVEDGTVDITAAKTTVYAQNDFADVTYGVHANNGGRIDIHGDLDLKFNFAAPIHGLVAEDYDFSNKAAVINVDGKANIDLSGRDGNAVAAIRSGSTVNVGGGTIKAWNGQRNISYGLLADVGNINVNMNADKTAAGKNTTVINGNLKAYSSTGPDNHNEDVDSVINVGLSDNKSSLTGVAFAKDINYESETFKGTINMYLQNGATWNNQVWGKIDGGFDGSHVAKLAGGASEAAAGNIFQKDSRNLTIDNYSGNTNIFYEHAGDGVTFNAGDTIIKHAEKDSVVNLITSNKGLSINAETINDTLSALAGKLTYTNYKDGERNLDGKVKIAGGLTSDSLTVAAGDILFSSTDGKGNGVTNLNVQAPDHQTSTSFGSTLTGDTEEDLEYVLGGVVKDGSYKFTENTTINVNGKDARGMDFAEGTVVDASGKTLTINVTDGTKLNAGISQIKNVDSHVKADKIVIKLDSKDASGTTHAIHQDKGNLTIDGDVDINITGQRHTVGVYSHAGSTTINGNVKVVLDGNHGGFAEYGAAGIYAHAGYGGAVGGTVNVNGNVDISGVGNGLFANIGGGTINVNGGRINIIDDNTDTGYSAIYSTCGAINMNTVKDEKGNVIGAGNNKVDITGNVVVSVGAVNYVDCYEYSLVNLGLTTKDSQLTGVIYNEFPEGGKTASQGGNKKLFTGEANLWLQNGATWTNEQQGTLANVYQGEKFTGSHVAKLTGGATAEAAGNIYQKENGALTIDNYSGNTNIFYEHAGDGVTFNAGDTVIRHAEKDSVVNLITSNKGMSLNADTINNTLNALAGKLTYSNYAKGERNLDGKVKIAGGLTSDSVTMAVGDILFNEADGKGSGAEHITVPSAPETQVSTSFNTTLTGDTDKDLEYVLGGAVKDGSYKFTEATSINVSGEGAKGMNLVKGTTVDASGKTLTVNVTDASKGNAGISQDVDVNSTIKADKLVIKLDSEKSGKGAQAIRQDKGNLTIDANVDIDVKGDNSTMGIYSHAGSTTVNGDVKVVLDGKRGGFNEYGAAGIYAHAGYGGAVGGTVNVNGNVDISGVGNGLFANIGGATINVNGGKINIVDTDKKNGYSAIYAANGKINVNTVKDADGNVTGAGNNKVDITGNIVTSVGAVNYVDCSTETEVNVGLTTKDSQLTGVVYNQFPEGGKTVSQKGDSKTFTGTTNLWLQNGATWTNEQQGVLPSVWGGEQFKGSRVNKLAGGATAEAAGNIYQNDSNSLTIDNYSGVTNIIYAHGGDGTSYAAGDTVIKHAEAGSVVNMITSNQGVTDISAALNALAGKLTYLNYATANGSERNLNGYVKLAGGLTSDSVTMVTGDIRFSEETGKGSGTDNIKFADEPDNQTAKTFNSTLTGERLKDLEYVMGGVVKDGTYKFTENTAINVSGEGAKGMDFVKDTAVDASGKTLTVNVTEASKGNAGISQDVDVNSTIKADKLVIKLDSEKSGKGAQAIRQYNGNLTIDGNVDIDVKGDNSTMGIYSHAGSTTVNGDVKVVLDGKRGGFNEYGAAGIYAHAGYGGAAGGTVNVNGNVDISGVGNGLFANIGGATINVNGGKINIVDTDKKNGYSAIYATCGAINMNTVKDAAGKVIGAGNNKVDITGNVVVSVGAVNYVDCCTETEVNLGLTTKDSKLTGVVYNQFPEGGKTVSQRGDSKTFTGAANLWLQNGALWTNEQQGVLPSVWGGEQFKGSFVTNLVGGTNADNAGQIYQKDTNNLTIDTLSGSIRVIYDHEFEDAETRAAGDKKIVYKAGDTVINNAKDGSQVIMATGSNGINTFDKDSVEDAFKGLANKLIYKDAEKNPGNLKAELQLGGGLTGSNVSWSGDIEWDGNNGSYKLDSAEQSIKLLYDEDAVSKDTRAAIMSGMVGWRNAATDTYRARAGAYGEDNQGVWARTWGGQNKYSGNNTSFKNSYWAGQVGYDKTLANGWNVGVAFDYMTGDDSYYAGSGDTKTYTLGLYGSKEINNNEFIDLTAKVGRVSNDFETKDILGRTVKGDYKANGFSFSGQYSKRFGSEAAGYFEPQAQLTIGRLGSCDFDSTGTLEGHISQDAFTSIVGRLGIEAGQASDHGRYFARLSLSHEFAGDVDTHFSDSSATMTREFNLDGTWCDLTVGGTYDLSDKVSFYGDVTKTLTGDYKQDWKVNAGLRFTF